MHITSRDNSLLRQARAVRDGKVPDLIFVEGLRLCEEALRSNLHIAAVIYSAQIARKEKAAEVIAQLEAAATKSGSVSEKLLESVSYTKTPQGLIALAGRPSGGKDLINANLNDSPLIVVLHQINNPVNVGAILRTAEAAGANAVITTRNTSDPFSPKSLRGAMGSAFRLPIWQGAGYEDAIAWCKSKQIKTICADATAPEVHTQVDWRHSTALIVGPESTGLTEKEIEKADRAVRIPMKGDVESLNVSVAAGILLFEAARQRSS